MTWAESQTTLASSFLPGWDSALSVCSRVGAGDVLLVRGQGVEVGLVQGEGPFLVPVGDVRLREALPAGEPVRVLRLAAEAQR